ncbi:hypothetical protein FY534_03825 [Alicyclobacillus sp. TC]|uniref:Peptidase A4 family protein n=1 Tax=Alicyclobacillus tolerans TaxID=90970 RepID=A0A1M6SS55_9BACL|nr:MULTISPECIES: G1 family glutamic endopeptidase [Alicyclobacillus]QRF22901.1 hypothetical protein FY534_03825 [Alicyclobacillus sp. TC]SHK47553.1 Peptidase A4 family protein [Alicyclobacillus montanus]
MEKKVKQMLIGSSMLAGMVCIPLATMGAAAPPILSHPGPMTIHPTMVRSLGNGAKQYEFTVDGAVNTITTPPIDFHPLTASNTELKMYGFPTRPTNPAQLAVWKKAMSAWKASPAPVITVTQIYNQPLHKLSRQMHNTAESSNWSGYYTDSSYNQWDAVQGTFAQPTDYSTSANKFESSWVGLGGVNSGALIQDGTQMNAGQYGAWYEYLGNGGLGVPEINFNNITVNPGDEMYTFVSYNPNNGQAQFYVEDETNGTSQSATVNLGSAYYDGSTAEWINERPEINGSLSQLANYGSQTWTQAQAYNAYTGNWENLGDDNNSGIDMYDSSGQLLSGVGSLLSSTSFNATWYASGN